MKFIFSKKYISIFSAILLGVAVFCLFKFWPKSTKNIELKNQENIVENREKAESDLVQDKIMESEAPKEEVKTPKENKEVPSAESGKKVEEEKTVEEKTTVDFKISSHLVSWGYEKASDRKIDTIIIHSSYNALGGDEYDLDKLIDEYKEYGVAPHYLIDRKGKIYQLVADKNIAYHAGESKVPDGRTGVNNFSLGIELMNTKSDKYTEGQYSALKNLLASLKKKYKIKYVLGHNQIAPGRKTDPWNFDWGKI